MVAPATTRSELVRRLVLNEICDDYENLAVSIEMPVKEWGGRCGLFVEKEEIVQALKELVELGWAKAYRFVRSSGPPEEIDRFPTIEDMEDPYGAWFYRTAEGLKAQLAEWDPWPFDEENELKKGWTPLEN
jgi:hypothetical protein